MVVVERYSEERESERDERDIEIEWDERRWEG